MLDDNSSILVTCGRGLIDYLCIELKELGFDIAEVSDNSATVSGNLADCYILNLCLRTAVNVLIELKKF